MPFEGTLILTIALHAAAYIIRLGHIAYVAQTEGKQAVVLDQKVGVKYDGIGTDSFIFSPDGEHSAYAVNIGDKWQIIIDGNAGGNRYDQVGGLTFSPDGKQLAHIGSNGGKFSMVVNGTEKGKYDGILSAPVFTPDSRHMAFWAGAGTNNYFMVADEQEGSKYEKIISGITVTDDGGFEAAALKEKVIYRLTWKL